MIDMVCSNLKWFFYQSNCLEKERQTNELKQELIKAQPKTPRGLKHNGIV